MVRRTIKVKEKEPVDKVDSGGEHLVINQRPVIGHSRAPADEASSGMQFEPSSAPPVGSVGRAKIVPPETPSLDQPAPAAKTADQKLEEADTAPAAEDNSSVRQSASSTNPSASPAPTGPTDQVNAVDPGDSPGGAIAKKPAVDTKETGEEVTKRQGELQEYINSRRYFVPINAAARKRSIKVSLLLTFVVLLLAIVLIDLMLDTGIILLLLKIPHTHFFSTT